MKHKVKKSILTAFLLTSVIGNIHVQASSDEVFATKADGKLKIGNSALVREFSLENNRLKTVKVQNLWGGVELIPQEGSQEFVIKGIRNVTGRTNPTQPLTSVKPTTPNETRFTVSSTSEGSIALLTDGNVNTHWQSNEQQAGTAHVVINFDAETTVKKIKYTPRIHSSVGYDATGRMKKWRVEYLNAETESWTLAQEGTFAQSGRNAHPEDIVLNSTVTTTAIKLTAVESHMWDAQKHNKYMNAAEIDVFNEEGTSVIVRRDPARLWSVTGNSVQTNDGGGYNALVDGDMNTYYHSRYNANGEGEQNPANVRITLDRGNSYATAPFQTIGYAPRPGSASSNGNVQKYKVYVSDNRDTLFNAENFKKEMNIDYNGVYTVRRPGFVYSSLDAPQSERYVGFEVVSSNANVTAASEIDLFTEKFDSNIYHPAATISGSQLELNGEPTIENTTTTINGVEKTGKLVTFTFNPVSFGQGEIHVKQKVVMYNGDHFMRKFLEIDATDKTARFEYIDGEHLVLSSNDRQWTIPTNKGGVVQMDVAKANLGQPIYINGMFLGSEFPATDTQIENNLGRIRYFTGKNFTDFQRDGQLTTDGKYISWQTVLGASKNDGSNNQVIQSDFYKYIYSIATPSDFRIQYNSWFDNMMFIDDNNILESFSAVDKNLSKTGVRPLDSYVVDDGWNIYRKRAGELTRRDDIRRNGEVDVNTAGFWQFNSKFPNQLTPSSELVQNFGSKFGVWIGPRGGYNYQYDLAQIISNAGNGSIAGRSIDVADSRYVRKFEEMVIDWMRNYKVNYWKWDGFADLAQYSAFQSGENVVGYSETNHHMYGGKNGFYHSTDLWEKWIVLMKNTRAEAKRLGIHDLWISLTCYVNPSPWYLQWANSVWIQCVADRGERTNSNSTLNNKMDSMMTYRDGTYYDFVVNHQFQFPLANIYNHDPIYGKEGTGISANSMNGDQFRNYMFMQGTRGTAFWELYYSDSILNEEKYLINADFLEWAEANFPKLRNGKMIGGTPSSTAGLTGGVTGGAGNQEAYGFSGFDNEGGIISLRNPAPVDKTLEFTLNDAIGVVTEGTYYVKLVSGYTHSGELATHNSTYQKGDRVSITLKPGETQVWALDLQQDVTAPTVDKLYFKDNKNIQIRTSEHVKNAEFTVYVNGEAVEKTVTKLADLKSFDVRLTTALRHSDVVRVVATAGSDFVGNEINTTPLEKTYYKDGIIRSIELIQNDNTLLTDARDSLQTSDGFAVTATVKNGQPNTVLVHQGTDYALGIDTQGHPYFTLNGVTVTAKETVVAGYNQIITGVKENNGLIKIYIDGKISKPAYKKENKDFKLTANNIIVNMNGAEVRDVAVYDRSLGYDEVPQILLAELVKKVELNLPRYTEESVFANNVETLIREAKPIIAGTDYAAQDAKYVQLYDAYLKLVPKTSVNIALHQDVTANWTGSATASVTPSDRALSVAVDGRFNGQDGYTVFGNDTNRASSYMQIDLGDEARIDNIKLYRYWVDRRTYDDTAVVLSNDASFNEKKVVYYSASDKSQDVHQLGQLPTENLYSETNEGKVVFTAQELTKARYVRIYGIGVHNTAGNENHIIEVLVNGQYLSDDIYELEPYRQLVAHAQSLVDKGIYTEETVNQLVAKIAESQKVIDDVTAGIQEDKTVGYVKINYKKLEAQIGALVEKDADYTALDALINSIPEKYNSNNYTNFAVVNDYIAQIDRTHKVSQQNVVNEYEAEIRQRLEALLRKEVLPFTHDESGVSVTVTEGDLPEFSHIMVEKLIEVPTVSSENSDLYDISFVNSKTLEKVPFKNGKARLVLPIREGRDVAYAYYVSDNGELVEVPFEVIDDKAYLTVEHFSKYGLVYHYSQNGKSVKHELPIITLAQQAKKDNVQTNDNTNKYMVMLVASLAAIVVIRKRKTKK